MGCRFSQSSPPWFWISRMEKTTLRRSFFLLMMQKPHEKTGPHQTTWMIIIKGQQQQSCCKKLWRVIQFGLWIVEEPGKSKSFAPNSKIQSSTNPRIGGNKHIQQTVAPQLVKKPERRRGSRLQPRNDCMTALESVTFCGGVHGAPHAGCPPF